MAIKAKIANKAISDKSGYSIGIIKEILEIDERIEKQGKKEIKFAAQFEFSIISEGTQKAIIHKIWTGQNINFQKFKNESGHEDYNRLTRLCLNIGLLKETDLASLKNDNIPNLEDLEGKQIKFKLEPSKKNQQFSLIDISSIRLVD
jgi:hypothetical protein